MKTELCNCKSKSGKSSRQLAEEAIARSKERGTKRAGGKCSGKPDCAPRTGSALASDAMTAIKKDDVIGSYEPYAEWLASHERGYLYLKQAMSALAWHLHRTGNLPMMRQAVDEVTGAERALVDEKVKAPNEKVQI